MRKRSEGALLLQGKWGALLREALLGELGTLLLVAGEWENIVAFKSVIMSKAKLCEERHCKRNKVKLQQEQCYKKNITNVSLLQHVSFLFLCSCTSFFFSYKLAEEDNDDQLFIIVFFFFPYKVCFRRRRWQITIIIFWWFVCFLI
jgi:hypothetical protein